ncbi:N amino acid transport system protein [Escovopsis weberi]|uniref:N amino acid transport system protein n=1 Tax=Escovopsis weberi TaxID=150374 RepID=A0A0N0RSV4_ESCWE|nr:N amino acid transport system protein [Escovopsis weberi]
MSDTSITSQEDKGQRGAKSDKRHELFEEGPVAGETSEYVEGNLEKQAEAHFHRLGWKRLTVVLIVEAIALGALSLPAAFATLGMVAGVITTVGLGILATYASYVVGEVKIKFPHVAHFADAGTLIAGRFGYELISAMFVLQLTFLVGSHCLTGTLAFLNITSNGACSLVFGVVSAIILLLLAIPPSFAEVAILGYIDFVSVVVAIGVTMIATGVQASDSVAGLSGVEWSAWPKEDLSFTDAIVAVSNIALAYSFSMCQFSFMDEMHTPSDYIKSIKALGIIEIVIYTLTGSIIYAFVGQDVQAPALLSAGSTVSKVAFGIALPVIFISGSINTIVCARYIHGRIFKNSVIRFINTRNGWLTWFAVITFLTIVAWIIAEAIPFFSDLLSLMSSLFVSGFSYYLPAIFWYMLIRDGSAFSRQNLIHTVMNLLALVVGLVLLVAGTYASIVDIKKQFDEGKVHGVFSCSPL